MSSSSDRRFGPRPFTAPLTRDSQDKLVAGWLLVCCAMIFAMVVIGGITRLTESGLSIVRWEPIGGALPPWSAEDWEVLFAQYRASPQYQLINKGMDLAAFKGIFWWEYIHRLWGRLIGVVFALPLLLLWLRGAIRVDLRLPLLGLLCLGGLQGAIGWWMVASGLDAVPWVSPYRLAVHLGLALIIYACCLWLALGLLQHRRQSARDHNLGFPAALVTLLIFVTILAGAFVAGLDAGLIYNEFPLMGDGLWPPDYHAPNLPWYLNPFENPAAAQFHHRVLAVLTLFACLLFWAASHDRPLDHGTRNVVALLPWVVGGQILLGILTLLNQVPVTLGVLHQAGAVIVLTVMVWLLRRLSSGY